MTDATGSEAGRAAAARAAAAASLPDRIAFLGLGLIGGSIALALREAGARASLVAWTPEGRGPVAGVKRGVVDVAIGSAEAAIDGAGLVILAGPPLTIVDQLASIGGSMRHALPPNATVTDVGSTKGRIVAAADEVGLPFVGGHPMAGRETTGVENAVPELFVDRPWVVVPGAGARPADIERVEALAAATGARPIRLEPGEHDTAVAAISHLPLVLAAALVESVARRADSWPLARSLAATGWSDMTRLAKGDPEMGAGILSTNASSVADRLRDLREVLDAWIEQLDPGLGGGDAAVLWGRLHAAREAIDAEPPK